MSPVQNVPKAGDLIPATGGFTFDPLSTDMTGI